jgi:hypothetical protein
VLRVFTPQSPSAREGNLGRGIAGG